MNFSILTLTILELVSAEQTPTKPKFPSLVKRAATFGGNILEVAITRGCRGCHYGDDGGLSSLTFGDSTNNALSANILDDDDFHGDLNQRRIDALDIQFKPPDYSAIENHRENYSGIDTKVRKMVDAVVVRTIFKNPLVENQEKEDETTRLACTSLSSNRRIGHKNMKMRIHSAMRKCYMSSPSAAYFPSLLDNRTHHSIVHNPHHGRKTQRNPNELVTLTSSIAAKRNVSPTRTRGDPKRQADTSIEPILTAPSTTVDIDETIEEPSSAILSGITQPIVSEYVWSRLTGREFHFPSVLQRLVRMGIQTALPHSEEYINWKPADSNTKNLIDNNVSKEALRHALDQEMNVLVWTGKFKKEGYGSDLPLIKTVSIVPMSPKNIAVLLMDSDRVSTYNKISLGRKDEVIFQSGIDTVASSEGSSVEYMLDGEAKIVRNLTQPPVVKKRSEFITLMYARRLRTDDNIGVGIMGDDVQENGDNSIGYVVMSRAVNGDRWRHRNPEPCVSATLEGNDECNKKGDESEMTRSEILLGVNLLRVVPGQPNKTEVTAVTHVKAGVPSILATKIGVKGAIDFVRDIRNLSE